MHITNQPFHSSTRTAISTNVSPETKAREQVLTTSELQMTWNAGELQIRCRASRVVMSGERRQAMARRARGAA
ncbi:hypothetical protein N5C67_00075 [Comamonas thiooxydans]|uniref:hypothetical protein n=1 Tax=Comamonas thiooxydans TaxID=363952 RepID=UPI00244704C6|nr:hypothetical protein [Comamonas thiooxydans]MDH1251038.1 hypothetical protein [Comamonas thiooxydans]